MSSTIWTPCSLASEACNWRGTIWRMVDAQAAFVTARLVDTRREQLLLDQLLDRAGSIAATAPSAAHPSTTEIIVGRRRCAPLLAMPFKRPPPPGGSRFRGESDPGVFHAADSPDTAAAELGYSRWRFLQASPAIERLAPTAHTAFASVVICHGLNLSRECFTADLPAWCNLGDFRPSQALARMAREAHLQSIIYPSIADRSVADSSVRREHPGWCLALLDVEGFALTEPLVEREYWTLQVSAREVVWRHGAEWRLFLPPSRTGSISG